MASPSFGAFSARTHHLLMWFWASHVPFIVALYLLVPPETFSRITLLYITLASVWACVGTHASGEDAALAKEAAESPPPT